MGQDEHDFNTTSQTGYFHGDAATMWPCGSHPNCDRVKVEYTDTRMVVKGDKKSFSHTPPRKR